MRLPSPASSIPLSYGSVARQSSGSASASRDRSDDQIRLPSRGDLVGQGRVDRFVGEVLFAGEEPEHWTASPRDVIANRPAQHRIRRLKGVEHGALRDGTIDLQLDLSTYIGKRAQVRRQLDADHDKVCASTESTAGRFWTIAFHVSPPSADPYSWPPVVPK